MIHNLSWHRRFLIPWQKVIYHKWLDFYLGQFEDVPDLALSYYPTMVLQEYFTWRWYCCYYPMVLRDYLSDAPKNSRPIWNCNPAFWQNIILPSLLPVRSFCWDAQLLLSRDLVLSVDFLYHFLNCVLIHDENINWVVAGEIWLHQFMHPPSWAW